MALFDASPLPACPLCGTCLHIERTKQLYGHTVCRRCANGFANRRQGAFIIDVIFFRIVEFVASFLLLLGLHSTVNQQEAMSIAQATGLVSTATLFLTRDMVAGRSLGKYLTGVQTFDRASGQPIGQWASIKRNLPVLVPLAPLFMAMQLTNGPRWGDGWANTVVVWDRYADNPVFTSQFGVVPWPILQRESLWQAAVSDDLLDENPYRAPMA